MVPARLRVFGWDQAVQLLLLSEGPQWELAERDGTEAEPCSPAVSVCAVCRESHTGLCFWAGVVPPVLVGYRQTRFKNTVQAPG